MPHDRHAHAVAADVVGVGIALGKQVIVLQSHEARRFARRQQARPHCLPFNHQDYLTRRAARRRAKTACYVVETNLGAPTLDPVFVGRVRLYTVPTTLWPLLTASDTFLRLSSDIRLRM